MIKKNQKNGFTLVELLIVITIMTFLVSTIYVFSDSSISRARIISSVNEVMNVMKLAQTRALTGYMDTDWGVELESDKVILFQGNDFATRDTAYDEHTDLASPCIIDQISLNGSLDAVIFETDTGETANYGTFAIIEKGVSHTILINQKGIIENYAS